MNTLKLNKAVVLTASQTTNASGTFQEDRWLITSHLFNHCFRLSHFPWPCKDAKLITIPKQGKDPKFPQNKCPICFLSMTGKLFRTVQRHIQGLNLLHASRFVFREQHSTFHCMRFANHVTLHFSNTMSKGAVFLDIEKAFDTTWHPGLLYIFRLA
jgi:hypothetical protein